MLLVSSCNCLYPISWSQVLSWEWRCSWSSADRRCSNYIWVINNLIAYQSASYIRDLTVIHVTDSLGCLLGVLEWAAVVTLYLIQCYNKACHSGGHYWDYSTILVPYYYVKSLQLIGGSGTSIFHQMQRLDNTTRYKDSSPRYGCQIDTPHWPFPDKNWQYLPEW